jgi:hypothetical protein
MRFWSEPDRPPHHHVHAADRGARNHVELDRSLTDEVRFAVHYGLNSDIELGLKPAQKLSLQLTRSLDRI